MQPQLGLINELVLSMVYMQLQLGFINDLVQCIIPVSVEGDLYLGEVFTKGKNSRYIFVQACMHPFLFVDWCSFMHNVNLRNLALPKSFS